MSAANHAVFLSYASQDAEAARRLCDALRAAGVEVWFDQSELVGGDAWDAKIRGQVASCALFVPVISAATQARREGYFRIEWKLAAQRTHAMADGTPFLLPVVIDETRDGEALVPAEFRAVQWTRLRQGYGGQALDDAHLEAFCEQVKRLLEAPGKGSAAGRVSDPLSDVPPRARSVQGPAQPPTPRLPFALGVIATLAIAVAAFFILRPPSPPAAGSSAAKPPLDLSSAGLAKGDKSIAVLPFANLSDDKDNTAFFSDGMHEDILTTLANIRELRVVSRTSVLEYRGTTKKMPQIGRELGVAYVLEGSVRRSGNQVRLTGQLIRAATDEHLWAKSYDRELTPKEMFSIQAALSTEIATALRAAISPEETRQITRRPTESLAAYDFFLKAREKTRTNFADRLAAEPLLESAVNLDPGFVDAWALLAYVQGFSFSLNDRTPARLEKATRAMEAVLRLVPGTPTALRVEGDFQLYCQRDYPKAAELFERALRLNPNDAETIKQLSAVERRLGRSVQTVNHVRQYLELEPNDAFVRRNFMDMLVCVRRYAEAESSAALLLKANPDDLPNAFRAALIPFWKSGSKREVEVLFARWTKAQCESAQGMALRVEWAVISGDLPETSIPSATGGAKLSWAELGGEVGRHRELTVFLAARGDTAGTKAAADQQSDRLRDQLVRTPDQGRLWMALGEIEALRGNREEALRCAQKAQEIFRNSAVTDAEMRSAWNLAFIHAWTNDKDRAIAEYARLLKTPKVYVRGSPEWVPMMKVSPRFAPLRGDPRFDALLNDPKNNEPLF